MIVVPFILIFVMLAIFKGQWIRKNNVTLYIIAVILAITTYFLIDKVKIIEPFIQGYLGLSLLYIVMLTGALKDKSGIKIKLVSVRREYSILGFIFISTHGIRYYLEYFGSSPAIERLAGVVAFLIMAPLFITSFMKIRRKMSRKSWVSLQRLAYVVYILIFIHLLLVSDMPNLLVYIALFTPYFVLKVFKEVGKISLNKKQT